MENVTARSISTVVLAAFLVTNASQANPRQEGSQPSGEVPQAENEQEENVDDSTAAGRDLLKKSVPLTDPAFHSWMSKRGDVVDYQRKYLAYNRVPVERTDRDEREADVCLLDLGTGKTRVLATANFAPPVVGGAAPRAKLRDRFSPIWIPRTSNLIWNEFVDGKTVATIYDTSTDKSRTIRAGLIRIAGNNFGVFAAKDDSTAVFNLSTGEQVDRESPTEVVQSPKPKGWWPRTSTSINQLWNLGRSHLIMSINREVTSLDSPFPDREVRLFRSPDFGQEFRTFPPQRQVVVHIAGGGSALIFDSASEPGVISRVEIGQWMTRRDFEDKAVIKSGDLELPLVFAEDFEGPDGQWKHRWETTDDNAWTCRRWGASMVCGLNRRKSDYKPEVRSPHNIALIRDLELSDFVITFDVRSTKDTGNHRDCCVFFAHSSPTQFYYAHLGAKPDSASGQIMIVNNEPRTPLTENEKKVPWDDGWHQIKVVRDSSSGKIEIYFDDMKNPHMTATDNTFDRGRIGIGSFDDMNDFDNIRVYGL